MNKLHTWRDQATPRVNKVGERTLTNCLSRSAVVRSDLFPLSLSLSLPPPLPLPHSHKHTPSQALTNRLKGYHDQTVPIVEHYRPKGIVNTLNGDQKPAEVSAALATLLEGAFPA